MRRDRIRFSAVISLAMATGLLGFAGPAAADINRPFGSHPMSYAAGTIKPNHVSQVALDQAVLDFYDQWKSVYLTEACGAGRYVVLTHVSPGNLTVSEGHGYGMMLAALMAGHDPDAQTIFDGMYEYFLEHPTELHTHLMAWYQSSSCQDSKGVDSATDGDLDVAFALLLADKQWGSCGRVNYHSEAMTVLADILDGEVDATHAFTTLGDWVAGGEAKYVDSTRSSDFMVDHFASFASASGSPAWTHLRDSLYGIVASLQASHSSGVGLVPDFIVGPTTTPAPAPPLFLEETTDGMYSYNACRVPWRLATDFVTNGDSRAKTALDVINAWLRTKTANTPAAIGAGYQLNGDPIANTDYSSMAFVAPFAVGAMVNPTNQSWLNAMWDDVVTTPISAEGYYENTLKLLSMIVMSGNWWAPEKVGAATCTPASTAQCTDPATLADVSVRLRGLDRGPGTQALQLRGTLLFRGGAPTTLDAGTQILVEDTGSGDAAIFDLSDATTPVPAAGDPACGSADAWKSSPTKVLYRNRSGALGAPACSAGSANGLSTIQYRKGSATDVPFTVATKRSTIAAPVGPLRVTLVLGATPAAGAAGQCGVSDLLTCTRKSSNATCQ